MTPAEMVDGLSAVTAPRGSSSEPFNKYELSECLKIICS